ncbi:MAG: hypothetical protein ACFCUM_05800 [Bacteroidales bacterium]
MTTNTFIPLFVVMLMLFTQAVATAQNPNDEAIESQQKKHMIIKNDNSQFIGEIISQDVREVIIRTENLGDIAIPKHEIKEIRELGAEEFRSGTFIGPDMFTTRYFLTTNGLPVQKGESYIQWNLFGPDFQFGVADNFGIGVMTSWIAMPIIGTAKYSRQLGENSSFAIGTLLGTGSWAQPDFGIALPYAAITFGGRSHNINFSAGYGLIFYANEIYNPNTDRSRKERFREGRLLLSVAGMTRISPALSLVFDSFIMPPGPFQTQTEWEYLWEVDDYREITTTERSPALMVFVPGIRWHTRPNAAFQFGFTGAYFDGNFVPIPIPMVQWFRQL